MIEPRMPLKRPAAVSFHFGASHNLARLVRTQLFLLCPNNSGSTFLQKALATSRNTWNLALEGQHVLGYAGPRPEQSGLEYVWGSDSDWVERFQDPASHDWQRAGQAWYFQATSTNPTASVFTTKSPPFLLVADQLAAAFHGSRFLIMVRDPYATAAGILRSRGASADDGQDALRSAAAAHLVTCFAAQRRNLERFEQIAAAFRYETMCEHPGAVEAQIQALVPALGDVRLAQHIPVKRIYSEPLRNMNAEQIARLTPRDLKLLNEVFAPHAALFRSFGYELR